MGNLSLEDQVKAANRDKLLAEAAKAKSEKEKVDFDLNESKKDVNQKWIFKKDSISKIATLAIFTITFLSFFIPFVVLPAFNKDNIELATQNAITKDSLYKQGKFLAIETKTLSKESQKNSALSQKLNTKETELKEAVESRKQVDSNYREVFKLYNDNLNRNNSALVIAEEKLKRSIQVSKKLPDLGGENEQLVSVVVSDANAVKKERSIKIVLNPNNGVLKKENGVNNNFLITLIPVRDNPLQDISNIGAIRNLNNNYVQYLSKVAVGNYYVFLRSSTYKVKDGYILNVFYSNSGEVQNFEVPIAYK